MSTKKLEQTRKKNLLAIETNTTLKILAVKGWISNFENCCCLSPSNMFTHGILAAFCGKNDMRILYMYGSFYKNTKIVQQKCHMGT